MINKILANVTAVGSGILLPGIAMASSHVGVIVPTGNPDLGRLGSLLNQLYNILNDIILPGILVLALIFFMWGVAMFILGAGDPEKREQGKHIMIWGIVALFVIVAVWGIVFWLANLFGVSVGGTAPVPGVNRR